MRIGADSEAKEIGSPDFIVQVPNDILGEARTSPPDSGAYESTVFEED